jgi:hypothetical protein
MRILTLVFIGLAACGGPKDVGAEGDDVTTEGDDTTETTDDTDVVPVECEGVEDAGQSPACLEALTAICRAHQSEAACWSAPPMKVPLFGNVGQYLYCAWTEVAQFANTETCDVGAVFGRCEAASVLFGDGYTGDPCHEGMYYEEGYYIAFLEAQELVDGVLSTPPGLHPDGALVLNAPLSPSATACPLDGAPAWCACGPAACEATAELP